MLQCVLRKRMLCGMSINRDVSRLSKKVVLQLNHLSCEIMCFIHYSASVKS